MYTYSPFLRVTPPAGPQLVYDLINDTLRNDGSRSLTVAQWIPEPVFVTKETVRRRLRNIKYGWRLRAFFTWVVDVGGAGEAKLVELGFYVNRNNHLLELHMSGLALYGRECVLSAWTRTNLENKNVAGVYSAEFSCVDLLSEDSLPPEFVQSPPALGTWHG